MAEYPVMKVTAGKGRRAPEILIFGFRDSSAASPVLRS
jgi:hypothetical protein